MAALDVSFEEMTIKEATVTYIRDVGKPVKPLEVAEATGKKNASVRVEMRKLVHNGVLAQPEHRHGYYDLPERVEESESEDVGGDGEDVSTGSDHSPQQTDRLRAVPVWSDAAPADATRMMQIDPELLTSTGIDIEHATVIPVRGSQAEPYLTNGQLVLAAPVERIQGADYYVYYSWADQTHLIAYMTRTADRITMETASQRITYKRADRDSDAWEREDGTTEQLRVVARVVGAVQPVGKRRAREREIVRMLRDA